MNSEHKEMPRPETKGWQPGHILDAEYEIVKQLATTDRCEIYLAKELQYPYDPVVVKRLKPDKAIDNDAFERFEREATVLRQIRHQFVLSIYDIKIGGDDHYFVTEYADRESLKDYLTSKPNHKLNPIEALEIAMSVCQGLEAAHKRGIVHRDIKPGNILLFSRPNNRVVAKLADFSIARDPDKHLTRTGLFMGTLRYASPEQLFTLYALPGQVNANLVDARSDLYSWAVVFFEMLTGETPAESLKDQVTYSTIPDEFPTPLFSDKGIPSQLITVLQKALRKAQELRYQSAGEVLADLESVKSETITTDIRRHLSLGKANMRSREWATAESEFRQGLALCEWYGQPHEFPNQVKQLADKLQMEHLCAQAMMHWDEREWQAAINALMQLLNAPPSELEVDVDEALRQAQSELESEHKYQRIVQFLKHENWAEVLRLAKELTVSYRGKPDHGSIGDIRKEALYAWGAELLDESKFEEAYYHLYNLYDMDHDYKHVAELCTTAAFRNSLREDVLAGRKHRVEWLEKAVRIDVIRNKVFGSSPQCVLAMTHSQIVQASGHCHKTI